MSLSDKLSAILSSRAPRLTARVGLYLLAVGLLSLVVLWIRAPVGDVKGIQNEDIAGITYNADLLRHGKVPLVDNLEYKAPGSFFLVAAVWGVFGRSVEALERFGVFWALLATIGVFLSGRQLYGFAAGIAAALLYALFSPITDSMSVNYNAWMITFYVWATVLFVAGLRRGGIGWFIAAGALAVFGALMKRQGAMIVPLFGLILLAGPLFARPAGWPALPRWRSLFGYCGGVLLGFLPIGIYYLANGGLLTFLGHYFGSSAGWEYLQINEVGLDGKLDRLEDGLFGLAKFMALPTLLASMAAVSMPLRRDRGWTVLGVLLAGHFFLSFVGASLGFRFYKGYYLQVLPAACWIAAHPQGPLLRWFDRASWPRDPWHQAGRIMAALCVVLLCLPALVGGIADVKAMRRGRPLLNSSQHEAIRISRLVKANTKPEEEIWVWGRWAWPIHFYAERLSVTPFYKVLGVITNTLTNTWKRPTQMTRFVKQGPWRELAKHLRERAPPFIITANNESYIGFDPFVKLLREKYRVVPSLRLRSFVVWCLKDRQLKGEKKPKPPKRPASATRRPPGPTKPGAKLRPGAAARSAQRAAIKAQRDAAKRPLRDPSARRRRAAPPRAKAR